MEMATSLKYDLENIANQRQKIDDLKTIISDAKKNMLSGLDQIRLDWISEGGTAFFDSIDQDWVESVGNCIDVLDDLLNAIDSASDKYEQIDANASNYLKF